MNQENPYRLSQLRWGTGFTNLYNPGYPLDEAMTWTLPRGTTSLRARASGSVEASWDDGRNDHFIGFRLRWVPPKNSSVAAYGPGGEYDAPTGLRVLIAAWHAGHTFLLYANRVTLPGEFITMYPMVADGQVAVSLEKDGITLTAEFIARSDSPITGW